eukprot:3836844-Rhodomonas_salina.3
MSLRVGHTQGKPKAWVVEIKMACKETGRTAAIARINVRRHYSAQSDQRNAASRCSAMSDLLVCRTTVEHSNEVRKSCNGLVSPFRACTEGCYRRPKGRIPGPRSGSSSDSCTIVGLVRAGSASCFK